MVWTRTEAPEEVEMHTLCLLMITPLLLSLAACSDGCAGSAAARKSPIDGLVFFQDSRTSPAICYAYMWGGLGNGGPALAAVTCEIVSGLLTDTSRDPAAKVLKQIRYLEDARTSPAICYAYMWGGLGNGGPALTSVPCDAVESLLERYD
jgi:hypothetical protein